MERLLPVQRLFRKCASALLVSLLPTAAALAHDCTGNRCFAPSATFDDGGTERFELDKEVGLSSSGRHELGVHGVVPIPETKCALSVGTHAGFIPSFAVERVSGGVRCNVYKNHDWETTLTLQVLGNYSFVRNHNPTGPVTFEAYFGQGFGTIFENPWLKPLEFMAHAGVDPWQKNFIAQGSLRWNGIYYSEQVDPEFVFKNFSFGVDVEVTGRFKKNNAQPSYSLATTHGDGDGHDAGGVLPSSPVEPVQRWVFGVTPNICYQTHTDVMGRSVIINACAGPHFSNLARDQHGATNPFAAETVPHTPAFRFNGVKALLNFTF